MRKQKRVQKILLTLLFVTALILSLNMVLGVGTSTITSPINDNNYTGTMTVALTVQSNIANNMSNISCRYSSSGGTASTYLVDITNSTPYQTSWTSSVNIASFTDSLTYNVSCALYNGSSLNTTLFASGMDVYSDTPVCSFGVDTDIVNYQDGVGIATSQSSTKDTIYSLIYAWILFRDDDTSARTYTTSAPTFVDGDFDQVGNYKLNLVVTDTAGNKSACTNKTIMVQGTETGIGTTTVTTTTKTIAKVQKNKTVIWVVLSLFVIIFLAVIAYLLVGISKKR